MCKRANGWCV